MSHEDDLCRQLTSFTLCRARRVITRAVYRPKGIFASGKAQRSIQWESQLERDLVVQLEFQHDVLRYREQPATLGLEVEGKARRYTPDFAVERPWGVDIIEVKPADIAARPEWQALFQAAAERIGGLGLRYQILTEREIRVEPRLSNIRLLLRYSQNTLDPHHQNAALGFLTDGPLALGAVKDRLRPLGADAAVPLTLLCRRWLITDLDQPIGDDSLLRLNRETAYGGLQD